MSDKDTAATINKLKDDILGGYERLGLDDTFTFSCNATVPCYTGCCRDINIFLTPYDILRLKNNLGISSEEFIAKYSLSPQLDENHRTPMIVLRMSDNEERTCPFLGEKGCSVYEDRPWACRMYPLGIASQKTPTNPDGDEFYYLIREEDKCKGHGIGTPRTIREYLEEQGVAKYDEMNELFKEITLNPLFNEDQYLPPQQIQMFYMASYNLDMFRRFVTNSRFFEVIALENEDEIKAKIKGNDEELLKFAFEWLKYSLFGQGSLKVRPELIEERKRQYAEERAQLQAKKKAEAKKK